jgi:hypothetical protein
MNQRGFVNTALIVLIVVLAGAGAYFPLNRPTPSVPIPTQSTTPSPTPKQTPALSPQPRLNSVSQELDFSQFDKLCVYNEQYHHYECQRPLSEFGCSYFLKPSEHLSWLEPPLPIMICRKGENRGKVSQEGVYRVRGVGHNFFMVYITDYVVFQNGELRLISSPDEFKNVFAPVRTREEALAFVEALNRGNLVFDTGPLMRLEAGKYKVSKSTISKTSALRTDGGFIVNAYTDFGGCSDTVYRKTLLVRTSGEIEEKDSVLIWESNRKPRCIY